MDSLMRHIDFYITSTIEPTLDGLYYHLFKFSDNDYKNEELEARLHLYLQWLISNERYEECRIVDTILKDYASRSI